VNRMGAPQLPEPFFAHGEHFAIDLPGARALFTTRRGGVSCGPYESLNLGWLTDDEPEAVERNRTGLQDALGRPLRFVRQVHGVELRTVTAADVPPVPGADPNELPDADGQVTIEPGHALGALTADCLPVAVAGQGGVAMLHAGWRGLAGGILARGVQALRTLGVKGPLAAAIGPGAGPCCYETGEEVHKAFSGYSAEVHRGSNLDLPAIAREDLDRAGVAQVHDIGLCTICSDPRLLFSHRRDHGVTGRQAGLAWLS
jgi:polyphenol oxidase